MLQYKGMSGCDPATHKICKNNAITMTVYKVPEVNMLVKMEKKICIIKMYYFLFVTFFSKLSGFHARKKPNILEIRYIAVQYSKDVFIYLSRAGVSVKKVY